MRKALYSLAVSLVVSVTASSAWAQAWPTKPVKIVVPYSAGGPADVLVRAMAPRLTEAWGQPIVVENRPGANEMIAAEAVAKAPGDGYTLLMASEATFSLNPELRSKIPYNPQKDFAPISRLVSANLMMVGRPDLPASNLAELMTYFKTNPGGSTYASTGIGSVIHLAMSWFNTMYGVKIEHVAYNGTPPALQDVMASRVDVMVAIAGGVMPYVNSGKLKAFGVAGSSRSRIGPNIPTFAESGFPGFDASVYFGLVAPAGTPAEIIQKISSDASRIVRSGEFNDKYLVNFGFDPV
ncbi:MAG: hypothetical protein JWQ76_5850, partial [Ramlibacter sp.]|nr:hypothetical protein [Ramlibacter sp.]